MAVLGPELAAHPRVRAAVQRFVRRLGERDH